MPDFKPALPGSAPFQKRAEDWRHACFQTENDGTNTVVLAVRLYRFLEEALELVQALGLDEEKARDIVGYVYNRKEGDPPQEVGGVMTTLAVLCEACNMDMMECGEVELARVWTKVEAIRKSEAAKPDFSTPGTPSGPPVATRTPSVQPEFLFLLAAAREIRGTRTVLRGEGIAVPAEAVRKLWGCLQDFDDINDFPGGGRPPEEDLPEHEAGIVRGARRIRHWHDRDTHMVVSHDAVLDLQTAIGHYDAELPQKTRA